MVILTKIILFLVDLVLPLCAGYALSSLARVESRLLDRILTWAIRTIIPPLALLSLWKADVSWQLAWLPVLGVGMQVVGGTAGYLRARQKPHGTLGTGSYLLATLLSNRGILGALAVFIMFGEEAYGYSRLVVLLAAPMLFGVYYPVAKWFRLNYEADEEESVSVLSALFQWNQVPVLGVLGGLALNVLNVPRPAPLGTAFHVLVHLAAWSFLVPVGATMDFGEMRKHWRHVVDILPIKFVLTPLIIGAAGWAVGLDGTALYVVVLLSASPTAINAVVTARIFDLNPHLAAAAFVLTTGFYLAVIFPLLLTLWGLGLLA